MDKIAGLGFCVFFQFLCMLVSEKSHFFSSESGATKSLRGYCEIGRFCSKISKMTPLKKIKDISTDVRLLYMTGNGLYGHISLV